jgi:hypothetical protein
MGYIEESTDAINLAKKMKLSHVGGGFYSNKGGNITHKSSDGRTLIKINKVDIKKNITTTNKITVQKDETMPDPLGQPSGISNNKILPKKKKKSLVEFICEQTLPLWLVRYQLSSTGSRIHNFEIEALNQKEALLKTQAFLHNAKLIFSPMRVTKKR